MVAPLSRRHFLTSSAAVAALAFLPRLSEATALKTPAGDQSLPGDPSRLSDDGWCLPRVYYTWSGVDACLRLPIAATLRRETIASVSNFAPGVVYLHRPALAALALSVEPNWLAALPLS
jgi:hypothetical protein